MSRLLSHVHEAVGSMRGNAHNIAQRAKLFAEENKLQAKLVDVSFKFIGARGLPKMDVVGSADPYFVASIDDEITFVSTVQTNTLNPVWNESWHVKNVPDNAVLTVKVLDKDDGSPTDDFIGKFETTISPGPKEVEIVSSILKQVKGTFWLNVTISPSEYPDARRYTFDGPIRFSRHFSPTVGRLTCINDERLYSTWKMHIKGIPLFFGDIVQPWNKDYKAAQQIFQGPTSIAVRSGVMAGHRMLYARSTRNGFGVIETLEDVYALLRGSGRSASPLMVQHRVKPAVYTYVITVHDDSLRFSETGAAFFVDFASKHALHANCNEAVRYSGEFHPRPVCGWENFSDDTPDEQAEWELVVDNNSGTYAPDPKMLPALKALLEYNFPGFKIVTMDYHDPELEKSREACRAYALKYRGVQQSELQPHAHDGEQTLIEQASTEVQKNPSCFFQSRSTSTSSAA